MPTVKKVLEAMEEETLSQDGKKELIEALQTITQFIYGKLQQIHLLASHLRDL